VSDNKTFWSRSSSAALRTIWSDAEMLSAFILFCDSAYNSCAHCSKGALSGCELTMPSTALPDAFTIFKLILLKLVSLLLLTICSAIALCFPEVEMGTEALRGGGVLCDITISVESKGSCNDSVGRRTILE